jgi:hypothetical protein
MEINVQISAIISAVVFLLGAVFQLLLVFGFPLAEYSWGGKHKGVLPPRLRSSSIIAALILLAMAFILLIHTKVLSLDLNFSTHIVVWVITIFMGLNTLGNLASKSKKEKLFMAPQTGVAFVACLVVSIFSV